MKADGIISQRVKRFRLDMCVSVRPSEDVENLSVVGDCNILLPHRNI